VFPNSVQHETGTRALPEKPQKLRACISPLRLRGRDGVEEDGDPPFRILSR